MSFVPFPVAIRLVTNVCVCVCLWHKTTQIDQSVLMRSTDRMGTSRSDRCIVFWTTDVCKYYILISLTWAKRHNCLPYFTVRDHTGMCHQSFSLCKVHSFVHTHTHTTNSRIKESNDVLFNAALNCVAIRVFCEFLRRGNNLSHICCRVSGLLPYLLHGAEFFLRS